MRGGKACSLLMSIVIIALTLLFKEIHCQLHTGFSIKVASHVTVQEHTCVRIPCTFTAWNTNTFKDSRGYWMIDFQTVAAARNDSVKGTKSNFHVTGDLDKGDCTLTITDAKKEDSGTYFFRFERPPSYDYQTTPVRVNVKGVPQKPKIVISSSNGLLINTTKPVYIKEGKNLTLNCSVDGNPRANVTWIKGTGHRSVRSTVTLTSTEVDIYKCLAWDEYEFSEKIIRINLQGIPQKPEVSIFTSDGEEINGHLPIVNKSGSETLTCYAVSRLPVNIIWLRDDHFLETSTSQNLEINVTSTGHYRCITWNSLGLDTKSVKISISESSTDINSPKSSACGSMNYTVIALMVSGNIIVLFLIAVGFYFLIKKHIEKKQIDIGNKSNDCELHDVKGSEPVYQLFRLNKDTRPSSSTDNCFILNLTYTKKQLETYIIAIKERELQVHTG